MSTPGSKCGLLPNTLSGVRFSWRITTTCLKVWVCASDEASASRVQKKNRVQKKRMLAARAVKSFLGWKMAFKNASISSLVHPGTFATQSTSGGRKMNGPLLLTCSHRKNPARAPGDSGGAIVLRMHLGSTLRYLAFSMS